MIFYTFCFRELFEKECAWFSEESDTFESNENFGDEKHSSSEIQIIYVQKLSGERITLVVDLNDTIRKVKIKFAETEEDTPLEHIRLILAGKLLEDDKSLLDYNIQTECLLHYVPKLSC